MEEYLAFDDVLLVPKESPVKSRSEVSLKTRLTKRIELNIPIISSNMDTVTEAEMAIAMARMGGIGILHRFCSIEEQVFIIKQVKRAQNFKIENPYTCEREDTVASVLKLMNDKNVGSILVKINEWDLAGKSFCGIVTKRDLRWADPNAEIKDIGTVLSVDEIHQIFLHQLNKKPETEMDSLESEILKPTEIKNVYELPAPLLATRLVSKIYVASETIRFEEAREAFKQLKIKKLPIVDYYIKFKGLITSKDIHNTSQFPDMCLDQNHRLVVGAAIGVKDDYLERAKALLEAGADVLVLDIAHGHSKIGIEATKKVKEAFPECELIAGNVATKAGADALIAAGADAVKIGVGNGSVCITRIVTGFGVPQFSAIRNVSNYSSGVHLIGDGGIRNSGDIVKALAAGANTVMLGSLLAGTDEAPGKIVYMNGKKVKALRGMAGTFANVSKVERSGKETSEVENVFEIVPEGVEGTVPYKGSVYRLLRQLCGGIRSGISYGGGRNIQELQQNAEFIRITSAGKIESGPHSLNVS